MTGDRERGGGVGDDVALAAARRLLRVSTRAEAADALHDALRELGGQIVKPRLADPAALPQDVSLGVGDPVVVVPAEGDGSARELLVQQLPYLLEDARAAAARCDQHQRQEARARTDALTGLADRGETDVRLATASAKDVVCLLDLDGFKSLNDTHGHPAGDRALRSFGALLRASVRDVDFVGRYGGDEFLVVFAGTPLSIAEQRMKDLVRVWAEDGPGVGVSVGIALVDARGSTSAAAAADRALYRAKRAGGAQVHVAAGADWTEPSSGAWPA